MKAKTILLILLGVFILAGCAPTQEEIRYQVFLNSLPPGERLIEEQLYSLYPYDPIKREYIRSLPADKRIEVINQIILAREQPSSQINITNEPYRSNPGRIPTGAAGGLAEGLRRGWNRNR